MISVLFKTITGFLTTCCAIYAVSQAGPWIIIGIGAAGWIYAFYMVGKYMFAQIMRN